METYLLKANISLIILYVLYRTMIRYELNHQFNRFIGLACLLFSVSFPFARVTINNLTQADQLPEAVAAVAAATVDLQEDMSSAFSDNALSYVLIAYVIGVLIFSVRMLAGLVSLGRLYQISKKYKRWGFTVVTIDRQISPFTFFNILFIGKNEMNESEMEMMILHEQIHKDQYHSLDVLLLEVLTVVFWFNPAMWLFKKDLKEQHEFFADDNVLKKGIDPCAYQQTLFKAQTNVGIELANYLSTKTSLTKRFKIMTQTRSNSKAGYWNAPLFLMLMSVILFLGAFSGRTVDQVDKVATYEQGEQAMMKKITMEIKYPASAREENRSGLVQVSFTVNEKGIVEDVEAKAIDGAYMLKEIVVVGYGKSTETAKGVDDVLKAEAIRVVSGLGKFTPAQKEGKSVSSVLTLPIKFKLD